MGPINREQVQDWLDRVHAGGLRLKSATETVASLKDSRRLNPRAIGTTDIEPVLASGLRTLESCLGDPRPLHGAADRTSHRGQARRPVR